MADNCPQPDKRPAPAPARDRTEQQRTTRPARSDRESVASLIAEAERIMGVEPIQTSRMLPGY